MQELHFRPSSELTFGTVQFQLEALARQLRIRELSVLYLDLHEVTQCDSAGLAFLIEAKRLSEQCGKILKIEGVPPAIHSLAEFCGVEALLAQCREYVNDK